MADETKTDLARLRAAYPGLQIKPDKKATPRQRVYIWLVGSVVAAVLPMVALGAAAKSNHRAVGFYQLTATGELLVISGVLTIAGLAELVLIFWRIPEGREFAIALVALGMVLYLVGDGFWYGLLLAGLPSGGEATGSAMAAFGSVLMFSFAAAISSYCVWLAGGND